MRYPGQTLIAAKAVLARYGGICGMTLHRWVRDPDLNFPKRLLINGRRYWRLSELLARASAAQMPSILIHAGILRSVGDGVSRRHHRSPAVAMKPAGQGPEEPMRLIRRAQ